MVITEIGGTVGDIESLPFLEAIRQFALDVGKENCLYIHLTLVPYLKAAGELKTKPTQHSRRPAAADRYPARHPHLPHRAADQPRGPREDRPVLQRADRGRDRGEGQGVLDLRGAAEPGRQQARRADRREAGPASARAWIWTTGASCCSGCATRSTRSASPSSASTSSTATPTSRSTRRSTTPASHHRAQVRIGRIRSEEIEREGRRAAARPASTACSCPAASASAASRARSRRSATPASASIPFFGICLGMQCAVIEFARNVVGLADAHSTEFDKDTPHPVICLLDEQNDDHRQGRHDAAGRAAARARRRAATPHAVLRQRRRSPSGTGTATSSTTSTASSSRPTACCSPAPAPTASWSRSSSCPTTLVRGGAVPSRVQVEADGGPAAVRGFIGAAIERRQHPKLDPPPER